MHKDDQMTPNERMTAFSRGEPVDRIPAMPFLSTVGPKIANMSLRELRQSGRNEADMQMACYRRLGNDCLTVDYGLHGVGIALGSKTTNPEYGVPAIIDFTLANLCDVDSLDMNMTMSAHDKDFKNHLDAAEILMKELGDECGVDVSISGPFTAASSIYSPAKLLRSIIRDPENTHRLLRFCTDALKGICSEFIKLGVSFTFCDPVASGTILRQSQYQEYVFPYTKELVDYIHALNGEVGYHICGDSTSILEDMVATGVDLLSLDNVVDMALAKERVGDKICLVGNVDPVGVFMLGTGKDVENAVADCLQKTWDSPNGFIIASGCDIPYDAPLENVDRFMDAVRRQAKWPLDPVNFSTSTSGNR